MSASLPPRIGSLPGGARDAISDVARVRVGHCTLADGDVQTGVTVLRPHPGDAYRDKVPAAAVVINGFGKSVGLVQVEELGVLETPIALTNTFSVAAVMQAQVRACIAGNPEVGRALPTVNPLVFECNDGYLNDIQRMVVGEEHYAQALAACSVDFAQGSVGAGRGMSCFGLKGGIGSASRLAEGFTVGALVLANYGKPGQLTLPSSSPSRGEAGRGARTPPDLTMPPEERENGSIIMILATDAPLDARQLRRLALRAAAGLARTGSVFGHGSGDIALAFSTAYTIPHLPDRAMPAMAMVHETRLDPLFHAAADACEQAILHALWRAEAVTGRDGHHRESIKDLVIAGLTRNPGGARSAAELDPGSRPG